MLHWKAPPEKWGPLSPSRGPHILESTTHASEINLRVCATLDVLFGITLATPEKRSDISTTKELPGFFTGRGTRMDMVKTRVVHLVEIVVVAFNESSVVGALYSLYTFRRMYRWHAFYASSSIADTYCRSYISHPDVRQAWDNRRGVRRLGIRFSRSLCSIAPSSLDRFDSALFSSISYRPSVLQSFVWYYRRRALPFCSLRPLSKTGQVALSPIESLVLWSVFWSFFVVQMLVTSWT